MRQENRKSQRMNINLLGGAAPSLLGSKLFLKKTFVLQILIVGILAFGNYAEAVNFCSFLFGKKEKITYHVGTQIESPDFPAPKYSVFYLGQGSFGVVKRVINNQDGTSFVMKSYPVSANLMHDRRMLEFLRKFDPEKYGIRVVKEVGSFERHAIYFEDVKGITLRDAVANRVLPKDEMQALLDDLLRFEQAIYASLEHNITSMGRVFFSDLKTKEFPEGIPGLYAVVGATGEDKILLKSDNILLDMETRKLVIIDPM